MIKLKKIRPLFQAVITTADKYTADELTEAGIIVKSGTAGTLKEFQRVIAVGDFVKNINVGDLVCINPDNYAVHKFKENSMKGDIMENSVVSYNFNFIELDDKPAIIWTDRDIRFVVEEFEEIIPKTSSVIDVETPSIINPSPIIFS